MTEKVPESPYKGLRPYKEEDARFFFGRDKDIDIILANLRAYRLTVLYGPSGVGKSSILHAGVVHRIKQQEKKKQESSTMPKLIPVLFDTWHGNPRTLLERLNKQIEQAAGSVIEKVGKSNKPEELNKLVNCIKTFTEREKFKTKLLIILDQFEEYFLYHPHRESFFETLPKAVNNPSLHANFLIVIREDSLAKLDLFKGRIPTLFDNYLRLKNLNYVAACEAIKKPIDQYNQLLKENGLLKGGEKTFFIDDPFIERIVKDVESGRITYGGAGQGQPKDDPANEKNDKVNKDKFLVETPYLQLVMTHLWREELAANSRLIKLETYKGLGGANGIAKSHLDEVMNTLSLRERALCYKFFHHLVTPSGTKIVQKGKDLASFAEVKFEDIQTILHKLSHGEMRIFLPIKGKTEETKEKKYEIFHDALAKPVLNWQKQYKQDREEKSKRQRNTQRTILILLSTFLVVATISGVFIFIQYRKAVEAQTEAKRALVGQLIVQSLLELQKIDSGNGSAEVAALLALQAYNTKQNSESTGNVFRTLQDLSHLSNTLDGHKAAVLSAAFSPSGDKVISGGRDNTVRVWKASTGETIACQEYNDDVMSVAFSLDGKKIASGIRDGKLYLWDFNTNKQWLLKDENANESMAIFSVAFSSDGSMVASGGKDNILRLWDVKDVKLLMKTRGKSSEELIDNSHSGAECNKEDIKSLDIIQSPRRLQHTNDINSIAFSSDKNTIVFGSSDGTVRLWDLTEKSTKNETTEKLKLQKFGEVISSVDFYEDKVAVGSWDNAIYLWDLDTDKVIKPLEQKHTDAIHSVAFSSDGSKVISSSFDKTIRLWHIGNDSLHLIGKEWQGHSNAVYSVAFSEKGSKVVSASNDKTVRLWDVEIGKLLKGVITDQIDSNISSLAFFSSNDKRMIASGNWDSKVLLWELETDKAIKKWTGSIEHKEGHTAVVRSVAFSHDGKMIASGSSDKTILLWDTEQGLLKGEKDKYTDTDTIHSVAFSPNNKIVFGTSNNTLRLWNKGTKDAKTLECTDNSATSTDFISSVAFSPDGKKIVWGSSDKTLGLCDVGNKEPELIQILQQRYSTGVSAVSSAVFSPDGEKIISGHFDGSLILWDVKTGNYIGNTWQGHYEAVISVAFSPDGKQVISTSAYNSEKPWNHTIMIWDVDEESWVNRLCSIAGRNFTEEEWKKYMGHQGENEKTCPEHLIGGN